VTAAAMASAGLSLAVEYPEWEIAVVPAGPMWGAYWQSADGRHRRYIVAPSPRDLLTALRVRTTDATPGENSSPAAPAP
jgi:hypothetical protein